MQIAQGIEMLEISATVLGKTDVVYPTLIWDKDNTILVDTGYPGQWSLFRDALLKADVPFETLNKIIITHQDLDHIGGLPSFLSASSRKIEVLANEMEKPFIAGDKKLLKLTPEAIAQIDSILPAGLPEEYRKAFKAVLENPPHAPVDTVIVDREELPYCGGLIVIDTPGHTPGHLSLYHKTSKTLIAADAMVVEAGQLLGPTPEYTLDLKSALESLKKFTAFDVETVICYHGGVFKDDANQRIAELAAQHSVSRI
jgi:glyoxylase-like metal-dependent hydrolase (beta-lactamase superfamily II)